MALDFREIRKTIIDSIKSGIGPDLAQQEDPNDPPNTYGIVLIARPNNEMPIPDYPYAVVDITAVRDDDWFLTNVTFDELTDQHQYETIKQIDFQITIYGGDATRLAHKLATAYRSDDLLQIVYDGGLGLVDVQATSVVSELLQTDFLEVSFVQLSVRVNDVDVDPNLESIENVILDGDLNDGLTIDPIEFQIDTTS